MLNCMFQPIEVHKIPPLEQGTVLGRSRGKVGSST